MSISRRDRLKAACAAPLILTTLLAASAFSAEEDVSTSSPAAVPAPTPAAATAAETSPPLDERSWILEPEFAVNLPQPLEIGVRAHRPGETRLSWFADGGYFYFPIGGGGGRYFNAFGGQAGARYSPREGLPYFGRLSLGYRSMGLVLDMSNYKGFDSSVIANQGMVSLYTIYAEASVGAEWKVSRRLALGFDLGVQVPVLGWGGMNFVNNTTGENSSNSATLAVDASIAIGRWARLILPQVTLIRLTWLMP